MKLFCKIILILVFLSSATFSFAEEETFSSFAARVDSFIEGANGLIVSVDKNAVYTDLGKKSGVFKGCELLVSRYGEDLLHPITGESLGKKRIKVGSIKISDVYDNYSIGVITLFGDEKPKKGDIASVSVAGQLPVSIAFIGLDAKISAEAKYSILESRLVKEDAESKYSIKCALDGKNSVAKCSFSYADHVISSTDVTLMLPVITTASSTVKITSGKVVAAMFEASFDGQYTSVAIGKMMGEPSPVSVALADEKKIHIFALVDNALKEVALIEGDFIDIVNIETADLNGNGTAEIFVSHLEKKGAVSSMIYEYNGSKFVQVKKDIRLLFRSFFSDGSKKIIAQAFAEGDFAGLIYTYTYGDKGYDVYEAFEKSYGAKLYGFAYGAFGGRGRSYTANFDGTGNLTFISSEGDKYVFGKQFGYTPHKLIYSKTIMKGVEKDNQGAVINIFDTKTYGFPVYQRIIELETSPGKFFMLVNDTDRRRGGGVDYLRYYSALYMFIRSEALPILKLSPHTRASLEADIVYSPEDKYIAVLSQKGRNGRAFTADSSVVEILSINR